MRRISLLLFLALAGCKHGPSPRPVIDGLIDCAVETVSKSAQDIAGTVNRVLVNGGDSWRDALNDLARTAGAQALACAIEAFRREVTTSTSSKDPALGEGAGRAAEYLTEINARFVQ